MSAAVAHTPGPWVYYADLPSTEPNWHIVTNASRMRVLANVHIEPGNEMDAANARLIAAAPELLEALRQLLTEVDDMTTRAGWAGHGGRDMALAAIAKATQP